MKPVPTANAASNATLEKPRCHTRPAPRISAYDHRAITTALAYDFTTSTYDPTTCTYDNAIIANMPDNRLAAAKPPHHRPVPPTHPHPPALTAHHQRLRRHPTPHRPTPYSSSQVPLQQSLTTHQQPSPAAPTQTSLAYDPNHRYTIQALTDDTGTVVERYSYTAYGSWTVLDAAGNAKAVQESLQPYGYTGRRYDSETDQWYFRARYFDAELGRFISRDPLGYVDGMSMYRGYFVPGGMDPSGTEWLVGVVGGNVSIVWQPRTRNENELAYPPSSANVQRAIADAERTGQYGRIPAPTIFTGDPDPGGDWGKWGRQSEGDSTYQRRILTPEEAQAAREGRLDDYDSGKIRYTGCCDGVFMTGDQACCAGKIYNSRPGRWGRYRCCGGVVTRVPKGLGACCTSSGWQTPTPYWQRRGYTSPKHCEAYMTGIDPVYGGGAAIGAGLINVGAGVVVGGGVLLDSANARRICNSRGCD
ncbi:MAG: RHS repeat-associated core domain-containing protein [Planctomycetota bacterium]|nr:MAG: RHS repeat-associated core domain-containing protein [Planctomycetota bacterium]